MALRLQLQLCYSDCCDCITFTVEIVLLYKFDCIAFIVVNVIGVVINNYQVWPVNVFGLY